MFFKIIETDEISNARAGILKTKRGNIDTPVFMPVGTAGAVKGLTVHELLRAKAQIILGNTYHLFLRPGVEVINKFGSLHNFIGWDKPILTDSGGFQIFSIKDRAKVSEIGVEFSSHIDGRKFLFTPEEVVDIQNAYGSDIQMALDYFAPHPATHAEDKKAMEITQRWAKRARKRFVQTGQNNHQFAIVQGGLDPVLRTDSLGNLALLDFDGYAIGGLSVGEEQSDFERIIALLLPQMPVHKPRYLMGSGTPQEILLAVENGVDMLDCVLPTRNARNGTLFTSRGKLVIKNNRYKFDDSPLDNDCSCYTCQHFSRSYLRHLFISREINASILNTIHNIHFYLDFLYKIRYSIKSKIFKEFKTDFLKKFNKGV